MSVDYDRCDWLYPRKVEDLNEAYSDLVSILPQNLLNTRKQYMVNSIKEALDYYTEISGEQLIEIDKYFRNLDFSCGNEISRWREEKEKLISIKSMILDALKEDIIQNREISNIDKFLDASNDYISEKISELNKDELLGVYGPLADLKLRLRDSINRLGFMELLELYREYNKKEKLLCSKVRLYGLNEDDLPYCDYINAFRYGSILISDKMNSLNRNKAKNKYIPQEILDEALIFYYDTDSAQDAYNKRSNEKYSQNKESGNIGEQKVDYALKWLDSSYIRIKKNSKDKVGNDCIIIANQSFIDETQEYDHLIISSKGIFSIETKNFTGKIIVDKQGNWIRKQGEEEEGIKNPIQQIRQHEKMLASFLPDDCTIISVICIANDKAIIEGTENFVLPISKSDMLVEFIEKYNSGVTFTIEQMKEYERLIYKHMI